METTDTSTLASVLALALLALIFIVDLLVRVALLFYIPRNRKPTAALAWLFAIAIAPFLGTALFLVLGSTKLSKRRRMMQAQIDRMYDQFNKNLHDENMIGDVPSRYRGAARIAEHLANLAPARHNSVTILNGYDTIIDEMVQAINKAKEYVYVEFFALALDTSTEPFFGALDRAISRGVKVYVLFDTLGSRKYPRYRQMQKRLTEMGAHWHKMLPLKFIPGRYNRPDLRNHRKIVVVDNQHSFMGSLNMIDKTYHRKDDISYIELVAHVQGPAVNESAAIFASDWYSESGQVLKHFLSNAAIHSGGDATVQMLPSGPGYEYRNNLRVFVDLIHTAKESVIITNPYLVPDESLLAALLGARFRGVEVSILNSAAMDQWMVGHAQRSYYDELVRAGIAISLYDKPQLVHSKYMAIDEKVAIIGSSNLDIRSFELNQESSVIVYQAETAAQLTAQHRHDLKNSRAIRLREWRQRGKWTQLLDSVARLTSALQ